MTTQQTAAYQRVLAQATGLTAADKRRLLETLAGQVRDDSATTNSLSEKLQLW